MCYRVRRFWQTRKIFLWFFLLTAEGIVKTEMKRLRQCQFSQTQSLIYISILSGRWRKILLSWDSNVFKIPFWGFRNVHYSLLAELLMFSLNDSERGSLNSDVVNDAPTLHFNPGPLQYYTGNDSQDYLTSYWVQGSQKTGIWLHFVYLTIVFFVLNESFWLLVNVSMEEHK